MRKMYKKKKRSCPSCKPHKTQGSVRWKSKDLLLMKEAEKEKKGEE